VPAGQREVGLSVAAALAGRGPGGAGVAGPGQRPVPPIACPAGETAGNAGRRPSRLGLGRRPALDAGPGHDADRAAVPRPVHAARTSYLLHRMGWTPQVPVHRAMERDEVAITAWRAVTWAKVRG
jgi:Winged helix-turn helix